MGKLEPFVSTSALCLMMSAFMVAGCSNPSEDVRVTLCKDIVAVQVGSFAPVSGTETQIWRNRHAMVKVRYSTQGRDAQATCFYDYDAVDNTAIELGEPLAAYATSPSEVVIDGRKLSRPELAEAVKQAMLKQGREFVDRAKQGVEGVLRR